MPQLAVREPSEQFSVAAEEIRDRHNLIIGAASQSLENAIRIGEILVQVKGALIHGSWMDWVEKNAPFNVRTARRYISCFERRDQLKSDNVSHLSEAYALIESCNGSEERAPQRLHESNFYVKSVRLSQTLMGHINHEIKDRPVESWGKDKWVSLAAALEPAAELYSKLKSLIG